MSFLDALRFRLRGLVQPGAMTRELDEDIDFHLSLEAMQRAHGARGGIDPVEARYAARRRFGNVTRLREEARQMAGLAWFDGIAQDLRFALRSFRRTPAFTAVAVVTLAIGIGANTAIFSAVQAMLLRPLPFEAPGELVKASLVRPPHGEIPANDDAIWSVPKFATFRDAQHVFRDVGLWTDNTFTVDGAGEAERDPGEVVSAGYLAALRVRPVLGRNFTLEEDRAPGNVRSVLVSHAFWQRRFDGDRAALGQSLRIDNEPYTIVGILPEGFRGLSGRADLFVPVTSQAPEDLAEAWNHSFTAVARLAPGVPFARAQAETRRLGAVVDRTWPDPELPALHHSATLRPLDATRVDPLVRRSLLVLLGAVGLVLLVACANVANLFLVRAAGRRREIAVRLAIGAGRGRLVRQLLTESLLLAALGGVASVAVAWWGVRLLAAFDPGVALRMRGMEGLGVVNFTGIRLDAAAFAFAALLSLATGVLFGLVPALQATDPSVAGALKDDADRPRGGRPRAMGGRAVLAVVEIALALVLLAGSGLMLRSLGNLLRVDSGFDAARTLTFRFFPRVATGLPSGEGSSRRANALPARDSLAGFYEGLLERVRAIPGVESAALADCPPLSGGCNGTVLALRDRPPAGPGAEPVAGVHWVTPSWFATMRVPLVRGRLFTAADRAGARKVVLLSRSAALKYWPGEDPIGRPLSVGQGGFWTDTAYVVGIVGDVRFTTVDAPAEPDVYLSYGQSPSPRAMIFVRARSGDALALAPAVRGALREMAPDFAVQDVKTMEARVADAMAYARFSTMLLALFAVVALGLAVIGTYGVISFAVAQRTKEIGIRVALGATRGDVLRLVVGQGAWIAAAGSVLGVAGALAVTRVLRAFLFGVTPGDPGTLVAIVAVLAGAVLVASWLPARRAASVQPGAALRAD